jgi:stress-induced morphogen
MIEPEEVVEKIEESIEDAEVQIQDLTGTRDHYQVVVVSPAFEGKTRIKQHRLVYDALEEEMKGPIHALKLETRTPDDD